MSDKRDSSGEAQVIPDPSPQGDGNPFERMRYFRAQRDAVMRSTDAAAEADGPSSRASGGAEDEVAGEHRAVVAEYRRRQRIDRD